MMRDTEGCDRPRSRPAREKLPVLPDWRREPVELNAVYAAGRAAKPAARLFTDFLIEALKSG